TSEAHATDGQRRAGVVADHVLSAPGGLPADAVARAGSVRAVASAVGVLRTGVLVPRGSGDGAWLENASAQGVSGTGRDLAAVQDLDVRTGSLDTLGPGTVAVDASLASAAHVKVGDRLRLYLPDGTGVAPKVVATYGRGLGLAAVTLPRAALATHVTSAFDSHVLVRDDKGTDPAAVAAALRPLGEVNGPGGYAAARDKEDELNVWANTVMAAVLGGFAAVAAANTLVMTVLDRRRELGML
ncbi:ABC transporter permease, partial [Streptomyces sp. 2MCAF27]